MRELDAHVTPIPSSNWRGSVASLLDNPYVAAILCAAAVLWTVWTLADTRTFFNEVGFRGDQDDFACYYTWAYAMRDGVNPYITDLRETALKLGLAMDRLARADYPPTFILLTEPLTLVSFDTAYWIWVGLNLAALVLALFLLLSSESVLSANAALAIGALALFYRPIVGNLYMGQPHMILLAMIVAASLCFRRERDLAGGALLALAGLLKVYPLFLVGYLLVKRRWRAVYFTALGLMIGTVVTMAVVGIIPSLAFLGRLPGRINGGWLAARHLSGNGNLINIDAFVSRLFWQLISTAPAMDWVRRTLALAAQVALLSLTVYASAVSRIGPSYDQSAFALWVVTAALLSPTAWVHYMVLFLFFFVVLAVAALRGQASSFALWLGLASFLLMSFLNPVADMLIKALPSLPAYWLNTNFYALVTLLAYASAWRLTRDLRVAAVREGPQTSTC